MIIGLELLSDGDSVSGWLGEVATTIGDCPIGLNGASQANSAMTTPTKAMKIAMTSKRLFISPAFLCGDT